MASSQLPRTICDTILLISDSLAVICSREVRRKDLRQGLRVQKIGTQEGLRVRHSLQFKYARSHVACTLFYLLLLVLLNRIRIRVTNSNAALADSTCSCDSGKVCKFSNRCEVKSIHPTYSVYYHPGTSGAHGDGGYYYPPAGSSHPVTGGSPSRGSPSRGSPPDASPPAAGSPPTGGASPSSPALDLPGQVDITTEATAAFDSAAAAAGDATAGPGSIFTGTSIAQAENASAASSYVGGDLGDYSVGSAVALSGAAYDSQAYSQALVYGDEGGAASSLAASYAYNQGLALADSVSGGYDGGSGLAQSLSAATDGGVASSQAIGLGGYGGIGAAYADARAYDQGDVTATADATSFTPGLKTTADAAGKATGRGSVVKSDSRGVDNTGSASVTAVAGPDGEASGAARFASGLLG